MELNYKEVRRVIDRYDRLFEYDNEDLDDEIGIKIDEFLSTNQQPNTITLSPINKILEVKDNKYEDFKIKFSEIYEYELGNNKENNLMDIF